MHNPLSKEAKEMILGTLLGDGCLYLGTGNRHYKLVFCHSTKQREYFDWKMRLIQPISNKFQIVRAWHKRRQKEYTHICEHTRPLSYFTRLRKIFYLDGRKVVRRSILNHLTPLSIATWFMDDGGTTMNNRGYPQLTISTCSFSEKDNEIIQKWFNEEYGIDVLIHQRKKHPHLYFNKPNAIKLIEIIRPHIIPSMQYKLRYFTQNIPYPSETKVEDIV
jgi:hypothetical protein